MSSGAAIATDSRCEAMWSASRRGSLTVWVICSYSDAVVSGVRPARSVAITGAPGQTCSISSHLLRAIRSPILVACRQISDNRALFPIPGSPDITTTLLDPRLRAVRTADNARAIGSLRPRNGLACNVATSVPIALNEPQPSHRLTRLVAEPLNDADHTPAEAAMAACSMRLDGLDRRHPRPLVVRLPCVGGRGRTAAKSWSGHLTCLG